MKINILLCVVISALKMLPTIFLNLFIIMITCRNRNDNITTRILLMNLVVVDLIMGSFTSPFATIEFTMIYHRKDPCFLTNISAPISFIFGATSFVTLAALAIDSFLLFCYPFRHEKLQNRAVIACVTTVIWITPLYPTINTAITKNMRSLDKFIMVTGTVIILVNIFCYGMIYRLIRRHRRQILAREERLGLTSQSKRNKNVVVCAIMLLISTTLCYLPIIILSSIGLVTKRSNKRLIGYLTYWAWTLASLNSLLNPILKFYRLASVRRDFKNFWNRRVLRGIVSVAETNAQECSPR